MKNQIKMIIALAVTAQCAPVALITEAEDLRTYTDVPQQNLSTVSFETLTEEEMKDPAELLAGSAEMYLNDTAELRGEAAFPAASLGTLAKRETVHVLQVQDDMAEVMSENGQVGWLKESLLRDSLNGIFDDTDIVMYASEEEVPVYASWNSEETVLGSLKRNEEVSVNGDSTGAYYRVSYDGGTGYVSQDLLSEEKKITTPVFTSAGTVSTGSWNGSALTASAGSIYGPSGKETYYNLDMSGVIAAMRSMGFDEASYPYSVRSDGAKMLGSYVMVAANLNAHPKGSTMETSLGTALVCDTGGFAYNGSGTSVDIATAW